MFSIAAIPDTTNSSYHDAEEGRRPQLSAQSSTQTLSGGQYHPKLSKLELTSSAVPSIVKEVDVLPPLPKAGHTKETVYISRWIKFRLWFNTYRKFFTLVFTLNMVGILLAETGHFPYAMKYSGAFVVGNINCAVLVRNEVFGRLLYLFVNTCFAKWTPLWWRLGCTSVLQHLGGIHSACATSALGWLIVNMVEKYRREYYTPILVMGTLVMTAIAIAIASALPWVRNTHHNVFELNHRWAGWLALFSTWAFVILGDLYDFDNHRWDLSGMNVASQQDFWFTLCMTIFIALPWACTRRVPVDIELPSSKVAIVRFRRGMQQGLLGRISLTFLLEYHAFGIVSESPNAEYHYMICGVQGDFTKSLVNNPPKYLWTREVKFAGVSNTSALYKRGIRICTGTGIGAALSTCIQSENWYLIWIGSDQEKTFGPTISGLIHKNISPDRLLLWDSKQRGGRPDTMKIIKEVYKSWNAEVVFITSNLTGNTEMMEGCKEAHIPCFGTLWDF